MITVKPFNFYSSKLSYTLSIYYTNVTYRINLYISYICVYENEFIRLFYYYLFHSFTIQNKYKIHIHL